MTAVIAASLNMPGQDVKAGRRLLRRPARYRVAAGLLNREKANVVGLQEITAEGVRGFKDRDNWGIWAATPNEDRFGHVGNAIAWRRDQFKLQVGHQIRLEWDGATKGALFLPYVVLQPKRGGDPFVALCVHLPASGKYGGNADTRKAMYRTIKAFLSHHDNWLVIGDRNGWEKLGAGRQVARHGVDAIDASKTFKRGGARAVVRGVLWRLSDHPVVLVRGRFRARQS